MKTAGDQRRQLPSVDVLMREAKLQPLIERYGRVRVLDAMREELAQVRAHLKDAKGLPTKQAFIERCEARLLARERPSMRRVFNLTGTVIHTNLGRSVMPQCAVDAVARAMEHPVNLEFDLEVGDRGERDDHIEGLLTRLTGAEAALAVNNNAAAVFLTLNTLALGRDVPVSRGELVEIGGSFRVPDIMKRSGVNLVEVGTTNRTHARDYETAIGPSTAALMKVHTSNYRVEGFTASVSEAHLAEIAHRHQIPLISDLGSGTLIDLRQFGLPYEPTPREMLINGIDLVTFSGDKLLGGPQAGLIVGRKDLIEKLRRNPIKRALRLDKMTLAALEAILRLYEAPDKLITEMPVLRMLTRPLASIEEQALRLLNPVRVALGNTFVVKVTELRSQIGSGSMPVELLPSIGLSVRQPGRREGTAAAKLAASFRNLPIPVIGRVHDGELLLDLRCLGVAEGEFVEQLGQLQFESSP